MLPIAWIFHNNPRIFVKTSALSASSAAITVNDFFRAAVRYFLAIIKVPHGQVETFSLA
jgi:hypothetical protein